MLLNIWSLYFLDRIYCAVINLVFLHFREKMAFFTSSSMDVPVIPSEAIKSSSRHLTASQPSGVYPAQSKHLHNYLASEALPSYPGTASAPVLGQNVTENVESLSNDMVRRSQINGDQLSTLLSYSAYANGASNAASQKSQLSVEMLTNSTARSQSPSVNKSKSINQTMGAFFLDTRLGEEVWHARKSLDRLFDLGTSCLGGSTAAAALLCWCCPAKRALMSPASFIVSMIGNREPNLWTMWWLCLSSRLTAWCLFNPSQQNTESSEKLAQSLTDKSEEELLRKGGSGLYLISPSLCL